MVTFQGNKMSIGPSTNFANAGIFQNQHEGSSIYTGCTIATRWRFVLFDYAQLNVVNREKLRIAALFFNDFADFLTGATQRRSVLERHNQPPFPVPLRLLCAGQLESARISR